MDVGLLILGSILTLIIAAVVHLLMNKDKIDYKTDENDKNPAGQAGATATTAADARKKKRGALDRMEDSDHEDDEPKTKRDIVKEQRKAERDEYRKTMENHRAEREETLDKKSEARRKKEEEREAARLEKEEEERKKKEEQDKKEAEEYDQWKDLFVVDTGGSVETDLQQESQSLLQEFIDYIKKHKVVILEDLASTFGLKTQEVINRLRNMEQMEMITGVMDDKGKFIYISPDEMQAVAACIKRRGRMSISDLALESNRLIDLEPKETVEVVPDIDLDAFDVVVSEPATQEPEPANAK